MAHSTQKQILELKQKIVRLGALAEQAVGRAVRALVDRDAAVAQLVMANDGEIDRMEVSIEEDCLKVLALYAPAAGDLRFVVGVLKINSDLERMGDLAKNISKRVLYLLKSNWNDPTFDFRRICDLTLQMVKGSLDALVRGDAQLARQIRKQDNMVDAEYHALHEQIVKLFRETPNQVEDLMRLFAIARHLERLSDMAAKIAQEVIYVVEADIVRHQPDSPKAASE